MNPLEILIDILTTIGPPRPDTDRSIVGDSPIERRLSRFWRLLGFVLLLAIIAAALYVWVVNPRAL